MCLYIKLKIIIRFIILPNEKCFAGIVVRMRMGSKRTKFSRVNQTHSFNHSVTQQSYLRKMEGTSKIMLKILIDILRINLNRIISAENIK